MTETDIYKVSIDDAINFDERDHEILYPVFKGVYSKTINDNFNENKNSKILAYIINDDGPELIYTSKCNSFSELTEEINNLAEIVERRQIKNYVFIIGIQEIEKKYKKNIAKLTDEQKKQREKFISNDNKLVESIRKEFWKYMKEKSK